MAIHTLHDLYVEQLRDLYNAEKQLQEALPRLAQAAYHDDLRDAFADHIRETDLHVERLEGIFSALAVDPRGEKCRAMEGLIREADELIPEIDDPDVRDAALIAMSNRIEHYEIAGYGTASAFAKRLGYGDAKGLIEDSLAEEKRADRVLTKVATGSLLSSGVNEEAKKE